MLGALIGGAISLFGAMSEHDDRTDANEKSYAIQKEQLDFNKQRYDEWKSVYGSLQEDMGEYYKNLQGSDLSNVEIQKIQAHAQMANEKIKSTMTSRGINGSGVEGSFLNSNIFNAEMMKAQSEATADQRAMSMKQNFLALGLGQGGQIAGQMANTSSNLANIAGNQGNIDSAMWSSLGQTAGTLIGGLTSTSNSALGVL